MHSVAEAIASRDIEKVVGLMFEMTAAGVPNLRHGYGREGELWDFKAGLPGRRAENDIVWADLAADLAGFHNKGGGVIIFGISDIGLSFVGTRDVLDAKRFNDKVRRYLGDKVWVEFSREFIQPDQTYLGIALVPPRGLIPLRFRADAPPSPSGDREFSAGDLAIREGDSTRIYRGPDADQFLSANRLPSPSSRFFVFSPNARILKPDWDEFLPREELCAQVEEALSDDRTYVTSLTGIGGVGKTALACWAVIKVYQEAKFSHFVSVSAKDRALTMTGIQPVQASLTSFEDLLNEILEVLGFSEYRFANIDEREDVVRELLPETNTLLFVDNLETVEDTRVIQFLETLPKPVKAITTSRTGSIRRAAFPIAVGPLNSVEALRFLDLHARRRGKEQVRRATEAEKRRILDACSRVPLAIEWVVGHSPDLSTALRHADALAGSGAKEEELLEFCFRRVHSALDGDARNVLAALALYDRPQVLEAVAVACDSSVEVIDAALMDLETCSLVERAWDDKMHDFAFRMLPLTRRFAYRELQKVAGREQGIRHRLSEWYEGKDAPEENRDLIIAARRGKRDPETALVEAAIEFRKEGRVTEAEEYFRRAIDRNPKSWRARREYAELLRDMGSMGAALEHYAIAADNAPAKGENRALVFREWGMLLRQSGEPGAQQKAAEQFEIALRETPSDPIVQHALASCYMKQLHFRKAQPILEKLVASRSPETRARTYDLLESCYAKLDEKIKLIELRDRRTVDSAAASAQLKSKRSVDGSTRPLTGPLRRDSGSGRRKR